MIQPKDVSEIETESLSAGNYVATADGKLYIYTGEHLLEWAKNTYLETKAFEAFIVDFKEYVINCSERYIAFPSDMECRIYLKSWLDKNKDQYKMEERNEMSEV